MKIIRGAAIEFVAASHEDPRNPGVLKRVLATNEDLQAGQVMMVNWARLPKASSFQPHYHEDMQEVFIILNGRVEMRIKNESFELGPGDAALVSPREVHEMSNQCDKDVDYIVFGIASGSGGKTVNV